MRRKYIIGASIFIIKWINEINDMILRSAQHLVSDCKFAANGLHPGVISVLTRKIVSRVIGIGNTIYNPLSS